MAPTIDGLQEMMKTSEDYAKSHNLKFITHPNIQKCKTKCLAFMKKDTVLRNLTINGTQADCDTDINLNNSSVK